MKLNKILIVISLLATSLMQTSQKIVLKLTSEQLQKNLYGMNLNLFLRDTHLIQRLSQQDLDPESVLSAFQTSLDTYKQYVPLAGRLMPLIKIPIIQAILKDNPDAFEYLKSEGFLK